MVSPEARLPRRPDHSEASDPGIGADSIRHGGSWTGSGHHVAGIGVCCELSQSETETDRQTETNRLTCVSLCLLVGDEIGDWNVLFAIVIENRDKEIYRIQDAEYRIFIVYE